MAEKHTTLDQLKKLALRGKADVVARVNQLIQLMIEALESMEHHGFTVTLPASNWSDRVQTVQHDSLLADSIYWYLLLGTDADSYAVCSESGISADNITTNGEMTFHCLSTPESDLTVYILRLEVEL